MLGTSGDFYSGLMELAQQLMFQDSGLRSDKSPATGLTRLLTFGPPKLRVQGNQQQTQTSDAQQGAQYRGLNNKNRALGYIILQSQ